MAQQKIFAFHYSGYVGWWWWGLGGLFEWETVDGRWLPEVVMCSGNKVWNSMVLFLCAIWKYNARVHYPPKHLRPVLVVSCWQNGKKNSDTLKKLSNVMLPNKNNALSHLDSIIPLPTNLTLALSNQLLDVIKSCFFRLIVVFFIFFCLGIFRFFCGVFARFSEATLQFLAIAPQMRKG